MFDAMFETGEGPETIIEKLDMGQNSNQEELSVIVGKVIANNPKSVEDYSQGKKQALGYLVGQVMAETKGQANPQMVNEILKSKLEQ